MTGQEHAATVGREGMVTVYDHEGRYVGCLGAETWTWLLLNPELDAAALVALQARREATELRAALRYYAERRNYTVPLGSDQAPIESDQWDGEGKGARARAALAGAEGTQT